MTEEEKQIYEAALKIKKENELKFLDISFKAKKEFIKLYNESDTEIVLSFLSYFNKLGISIEKVSFPENFKLPII